ncbi:MAG: ferritin-like domain-containing protein [Deltaproteobacteria bacterium]|nr:ferritin-like domain-containing protein [Deltaproteobacteria bacterium]
MQSSAKPNFEHAGGAFRPFYRSFAHDLDVEAIEEPVRVSGLAPEVVERARRSWVLRTLDEYRSMTAFSELLGELAEMRAEVDVIGCAARVVRDEARHVDLCRQMVEGLGGFRGDEPSPTYVQSDKRLSARSRVLRTMAYSMCVGECISVAMIRGVREGASDARAHATLTVMLADESFHGRFGWWFLEHERPRMTADEVALVERGLPRVFAAVEQSAIGRVSAASKGSRPFPSTPFGSMSPETRAAAFDRAIHEVIVPSFERLGFGARRAWDARGEVRRAA